MTHLDHMHTGVPAPCTSLIHTTHVSWAGCITCAPENHHSCYCMPIIINHLKCSSIQWSISEIPSLEPHGFFCVSWCRCESTTATQTIAQMHNLRYTLTDVSGWLHCYASQRGRIKAEHVQVELITPCYSSTLGPLCSFPADICWWLDTPFSPLFQIIKYHVGLPLQHH